MYCRNEHVGPIWPISLIALIEPTFIPTKCLVGTNMWVIYEAHLVICTDWTNIDPIWTVGTNIMGPILCPNHYLPRWSPYWSHVCFGRNVWVPYGAHFTNCHDRPHTYPICIGGTNLWVPNGAHLNHFPDWTNIDPICIVGTNIWVLYGAHIVICLDWANI